MWCMPAIPAHRRLKSEYYEFYLILDHRARPCLKNRDKQK